MSDTVGTFMTSAAQMGRFKSGELWITWSQRYPMLFDFDDVRLAQTQAKYGFHYHEWLAAILIYESIGYLSLIEKYEFTKHKRKRAVLEKLLPTIVLDTIHDIARDGDSQCPDLICFAPDLSDWFFCEVKGPTDTLRSAQERSFERLAKCSGRPVRAIQFHLLKPTNP